MNSKHPVSCTCKCTCGADKKIKTTNTKIDKLDINKALIKKQQQKLAKSGFGKLSQYGYINVSSLTKDQRRHALKKALRNIPAVLLYKKLVTVGNFNKGSNPKVSDLFIRDAEWLKRKILESESKKKKLKKN
jgi:hypothetical protein